MILISSKNEVIKADINDFLSKRRGPDVGDLVVFQGGSSKRISHAWEDSVQLTREPHGGSFYASNVGVSYSGGLLRGVSKDSLTLMEGETVSLPVWFFDEGVAGAGRGVYSEASFKVYSCDATES